MIEIVLDVQFCSLNEYINRERMNKYSASALKSKYTNLVCKLCKKEPKLKGKYNIHITWYKPYNRTDHDNIAFAKKFIFDGLVKAGVLEGDSPKYVGNLSDSFELDKSKKHRWCKIRFMPVD